MARLVRPLAVLLAGLAAALPLAGCSKNPQRISRFLLQREYARAFKRSADAEYRMRTGVAKLGNADEVRPSCRPREPLPKTDRDWSWGCRVRWITPDGARHVALYDVAIDRRGCFDGRSRSFPLQIHDAVLGGTSRNPLTRIVSCP
jgi:hypothetical protein